MSLTSHDTEQIADAVVVRLKRELGFNHHNPEDEKRWARVPDDIRYLGKWRSTMQGAGKQVVGALITALVGVAVAAWLTMTGRGGG